MDTTTNVLEKLMEGDTRTFVAVTIIALVVFLFVRMVKQIIEPYKGFVKLLAVLSICFGFYVFMVNPDLFVQKMNGFIDWATERIEPLFTDDEDLLG